MYTSQVRWKFDSSKKYSNFTTITAANGDQMKVSHSDYLNDGGTYSFDLNDALFIPNASRT